MNYDLVRSRRKTISIEIKSDGSIKVRAPYFASKSKIETFIASKRAWIEKSLAKIESRRSLAEKIPKLGDDDIRELGKKALEYIPSRAAYFASLLGVQIGRITIRCQRTRWGSCSSKGNLNFNCLLMLCPSDVIDSVIVHEVCHRKEMNHSPAFYSLVLSIFPDYKRCDRWLKENGTQILSRAGR